MSKYELMWEKNALHNPHRVASHHQAPPLFDLDASSGDTYQLPNLSDHPDDQAFDELELLGFFVRLPFDLLAQRMPSNAILVSDFVCKVGSHIAILGYYVCQKKLRTSQGKAMAFGTWVDREGRYFDTTHFPIYLRKYPFSGQGIYLIQGKLTQEFGFPSIEVTKLNKLPYRTDSRLSMDG